MSIKIVILAIDFPPQIGGISHYLKELVDSLPPDDVKVIGIKERNVSNNFDKSVGYEITRIQIPGFIEEHKGYLNLLIPAYLVRLMQIKGSNQLLCGQGHISLLLAAWIYSKIRNVPFGVFTYGLDVLSPQTRVYKGIYNYLLRNANFIISISNATKQIVESIGVPSENIVLFPPSINPIQFSKPEIANQIKKRYGLTSKKVLLSIGRLIDRKGFDTVINILPKVIKVVPEAHYLIVGKGPSEFRLKELVEDLCLQDYVTFAGYVPENELPKYYFDADAFIMVSRNIEENGDMEGFGIVYLEAGLMEKPVIAGASGGVGDAVIHKKTGLLINPNEPEEIINAIILLLSNPGISLQYGRSGKEFVLNNFTTEIIGEKFSKFILSHQ